MHNGKPGGVTNVTEGIAEVERCNRYPRAAALHERRTALFAVLYTGAPTAILAALLAAGTSGTSTAGNNAEAESVVTLIVIEELAVTNTAPMRFPSVVQGTSSALDDEQPAEFRVDGEPWSDIHIHIDEALELEGPGGAVPVTLTLPNGETSVAANLQFSGSMNFPVNGNIPADAVPDEPGTYSGTFSVMVEYDE